MSLSAYRKLNIAKQFDKELQGKAHTNTESATAATSAEDAQPGPSSHQEIFLRADASSVFEGAKDGKALFLELQKMSHERAKQVKQKKIDKKRLKEEEEGFTRKGRVTLSTKQRLAIRKIFKDVPAEDILNSGTIKTEAIDKMAEENEEFKELFESLVKELGRNPGALSAIRSTLRSQTDQVKKQANAEKNKD